LFGPSHLRADPISPAKGPSDLRTADGRASEANDFSNAKRVKIAKGAKAGCAVGGAAGRKAGIVQERAAGAGERVAGATERAVRASEGTAGAGDATFRASEA
jgi:hypothetical protein